MSIARIIINIHFLIAVLLTIIVIIRRENFGLKKELPSSEDEPAAPKSFSVLTMVLIGECVGWVVFNVIAIQMTILSEESGFYSSIIFIALVLLNIACLYVFIRALITKSNRYYIIGVAVLWPLVNIFVDLIVGLALIAGIVAIGVGCVVGAIRNPAPSSGQGYTSKSKPAKTVKSKPSTTSKSKPSGSSQSTSGGDGWFGGESSKKNDGSKDGGGAWFMEQERKKGSGRKGSGSKYKK